jgi:hypothetical protein
VSQTAQTWAVVIATVGAALLGVVVTFIGTSYQQRAQASREARVRLEMALAELQAAAVDLVSSAKSIRNAYGSGTLMTFLLRLAGVMWRGLMVTYRSDPLTFRPLGG